MQAGGFGQGRARQYGERSEQMTTIVDEQDQLTKPKNVAHVETTVAAPPCAMVIFGAGGDLTKRLVIPALYNLSNAKQLSDEFQLVGISLTIKTVEEWRQGLTETINNFTTSDSEAALDHIVHNDPVELISAKASFDWLTVVPKQAQSAPATPGGL